ncbi:hypothetical protein [Occallatibacter riparius]|uniref:PKD domain-containing protein n=1 Tax=Occallatibacter riparius TaxID=1002689 RepID=A0A9J7BXU0_9BACT|nr:hypothetical protein [Occallatibacter riparius]UWZ86810.1 hypothetical protein MOP44_12875 [Occallatibacter riparius]
MNLAQFMSACIAALTFPITRQLAPARAGWREGRVLLTPSFRRSSLAVIGIAFCLANLSVAQQGASPSPLGSDAIMGFEVPTAWSARIDGLFPDFAVASTTNRTQGSAALAVNNPPHLLTLTSRPVASTAAALTGIGKDGAILQLDILLPPDKDATHKPWRERSDSDNDGWIMALVSSRSRGLFLDSLGKVKLENLRAGTYNTVAFPIPERVSSALDGKDFNDLVFQFVVGSPEKVRGTLVFDNLRVHSVDLVQSPTGNPPPAGYGGSLDLVVSGDAPVSKSFDLGPTQIPAGFHLKKGTAGSTTVQLALGLDSKPSLTCTYNPDKTDTSNESYILQSCTGTNVAGDLVSSNWISLTIQGGDSSQQIRAQIALNPLGDRTGSGLIPAMPTFWGDADACTPAPIPGTVVTTSTSCSNQTAQANKIINDYFNQVRNSNPARDWIVTPVPESATRHGDGTPTDNLTGKSTSNEAAPLDGSAPNSDPPFDTGGDLNPGGSFDAYWRLSGNLTPTAVSGTDENLTHFDSTFTAHGVLFGDDVDVVDAKLTADTDSGATTPAYKPATSSGTLNFYVLGEEIPSGGLPFNPSTGFSVDPSWNQEYNLPSVHIWIFSITLGATVDADLNAQGSAALSGADLSVIPTASVGGHISGGIDLGIASGTVDAKVNLLTVSTPVSAQVKWVIHTEPNICATTMNGSLKGDLNLSSGGGEVNLQATFGDCPFCYTDSYTLFKWKPLATASWNLFNDTIDTQLFELPTSLCTYPITVNIVSPAQGATLSSGLPITLHGSAAPNDTSLSSTATYQWTFTKGANASTATIQSGANTANPVVVFGAPTSGTSSTWTIGLTATTTVTDSSNHPITKAASATPVTVTVSNLQNGVYITQMINKDGFLGVFDDSGALDIGNNPLPETITGLVSGATGALNTTFTVAYCNDQSPACTNPGAAVALPVTGAATSTPSALWSTWVLPGYQKVTMTTTQGASPFASDSVIVFGTAIE